MIGSRSGTGSAWATACSSSVPLPKGWVCLVRPRRWERPAARISPAISPSGGDMVALGLALVCLQTPAGAEVHIPALEHGVRNLHRHAADRIGGEDRRGVFCLDRGNHASLAPVA